MVIVLLTAIKSGRVSASLIELALNKKRKEDRINAQSIQLESKKFYKKPMSRNRIIIKLGSNAGQQKILRKVGKGNYLK